jgi:lysophospholipase L1-like esterase
MRLAYGLDPNRGRLARAWALPYFMTYQPVSQLAECSMVSAIKTLGARIHRIPIEYRGELGCQSGEAYLHVNRFLDNLHYRFSDLQAAHVREAVAMVRTAGTRIAFVEFPFVGMRAINPSAYDEFQPRVRVLAGSLAVPLFDLSSEMTEVLTVSSGPVWFGPAHMQHAGARTFAPRLAGALAPAV